MTGKDTLGPLLSESIRSYRSVTSERSGRSDTSSKSSQRIDNLSSHLLRTQSNRDPMEIYEIMEILGEGSMGSVSRVRKRQDAIGGSARKDFVKKFGQKDCCFGWLDFIKFPPQKDAFLDSSRTTTTLSSSNGTASSAKGPDPRKKFYRKQSSIVKHNEEQKAGVYALKSIHLDRCTTTEYVEELKVRLNTRF